MITSFGKFCRILRLNNNEILGDMADKLGVTSSYLSAVETGKRETPISWLDKIVACYNLSQVESNKLEDAIYASKKELRINLSELSREDANLIVSFARKFESFDEDKKNVFKELFKN